MQSLAEALAPAVQAAPLAGELTASPFLELTRTRVKGRRFRWVPKGNLAEAELSTMIPDLLRVSSLPGRGGPSPALEQRFPGRGMCVTGGRRR